MHSIGGCRSWQEVPELRMLCPMQGAGALHSAGNHMQGQLAEHGHRFGGVEEAMRVLPAGFRLKRWKRGSAWKASSLSSGMLGNRTSCSTHSRTVPSPNLRRHSRAWVGSRFVQPCL